MQIPFGRPFVSGKEKIYLNDVISKHQKFSGDGPFTKLASAFLEKKLGASKVLLTTSCTHALEMAAILCDIKHGDEIIMPSYTFVSSANAFVLRGASIVWVDIEPETMNLSIESVKNAITPKTKAIVPIQYGGVSCDMDALMILARSHGLFVIEDAAQSIGASYRGKQLGTLGDFGCLSFHETKNIHCGEGGALVINNPAMIERAEIIREKGTNRSKFFRGQIDKYTWVDLGSSYLPSELNAAFLMAQLESEEMVTLHRKKLWNRYHENLSSLSEVKTMQETTWNEMNGHLFYLFTDSEDQVLPFTAYLKENGVQATFHYVPLHSSPFGKTAGRPGGTLRNTEMFSSRLVRLPLYYDLSIEDVDRISKLIHQYFKK